MPFRPDDPLFGLTPDMNVDYGARLGLMAPRGERGVLKVPIDSWMRLNCNPFYGYLEERVRAGIEKVAGVRSENFGIWRDPDYGRGSNSEEFRPDPASSRSRT